MIYGLNTGQLSIDKLGLTADTIFPLQPCFLKHYYIEEQSNKSAG